MHTASTRFDLEPHRRIIGDVARIGDLLMRGFRILRIECRLIIGAAAAGRDILIDDAANAAFDIDTIVHTAWSDDIASNDWATGVVVNIHAVVAAAVVDDIVQELHPIGACAGVLEI